nr:hypothetical protein Iba_chr12fCG8590 [Ipomoea batatas]
MPKTNVSSIPNARGLWFFGIQGIDNKDLVGFVLTLVDLLGSGGGDDSVSSGSLFSIGTTVGISKPNAQRIGQSQYVTPLHSVHLVNPHEFLTLSWMREVKRSTGPDSLLLHEFKKPSAIFLSEGRISL